MHEFSLAINLIKQVTDIARENRLERVEQVVLDVGALQLVVPEALEMAFRVAAEGTSVEGARLLQREVPARAVCRECGLEFNPAIDSYLCPKCGRADAEIVAGRDIILSSLSGPAKEHGGDS